MNKTMMIKIKNKVRIIRTYYGTHWGFTHILPSIELDFIDKEIWFEFLGWFFVISFNKEHRFEDK